MRIQIGNLDQSTEDRTLARLFARYGAVLDAHVATHRETGRSTGVGFVEMDSGASFSWSPDTTATCRA